MAARVVDDAGIGVGLIVAETHQQPSVVGGHIEAEGSRLVAVFVVETDERLLQTHDVTHGEAFAPQFNTTLIPDFVCQCATAGRR